MKISPRPLHTSPKRLVDVPCLDVADDKNGFQFSMAFEAPESDGLTNSAVAPNDTAATISFA